MKKHLVILADDLSGAADCAVPFARSGFATEVFLQPEFVTETEAPIVSVDLNTRELTPGQAVQVTWRAINLIPATADTIWYRKIDSTLRGNIGPDVLATWRRMPHKKIILCAPAFPATGRTTIKGEVLVNGVPLEKISQRRAESLSKLFSEVGLQTRPISLDVVRSGSQQIVNHLKDFSEVTVALLDAQTNDDLLAIADAGLQLRQATIFVGSAGLAHQIARHWAGSDELPLVDAEAPDSFTPSTPGRAEADPYRMPDKPILVVIGSKSPVSRAQFAHLSNSTGIDRLSVPISALESGGDSAIVDALNRAIADKRDLAITTELKENLTSEARFPTENQDGAALMQTLGTTLRPFLDRFSALILTGGETARGVLTQSEIGCLRMLNELEPGVTLSIGVSKPGLPIVMKAGAFGTPATLMNALEFLRSRRK
jgi:D-threonate/D-erythronate kinase